MSYTIIKANFDRGLWSAEMVRLAAKKGVITAEQAEAIIKGE